MLHVLDTFGLFSVLETFVALPLSFPSFSSSIHMLMDFHDQMPLIHEASFSCPTKSDHTPSEAWNYLFHLMLRVLFIMCMLCIIFYVKHSTLLDDAYFLSVHKNHTGADLSYHFATLLAPRIIPCTQKTINRHLLIVLINEKKRNAVIAELKMYLMQEPIFSD